ncbi:MAG: MraY family glycosyltransferase [Thermoguttaceae bacterium]
MCSLATISLATFWASLLLTLGVRALARRWGVVDRPDGRRKLHDRPIPLWGGVAVYGATAIGLLALWLRNPANAELSDLSAMWLLSAGFVCLFGSLDDLFDLSSRVKLALQVVSVSPIVLMGHYVDRLVVFGCPIELGWLGVPLTVLWLVGCINALNLLDGMDGLASIIGLAALIIIGAIAAGEGHGHVALMALAMASSLSGFLIYNLPPASVFLGDSGSMVIGLSLGLFGIEGNLKTTATLAITAPAVVMTLPMFDICAAVVRRKLTGRRLDAPDRLHIHHRLLDRGWTPWQVLCLIGAVCLLTGAAAAAATIFRRDALAWIAAVSLIVLMIRLRLFGYEEFALAKGALVRARRACFRFLLNLLPWRRNVAAAMSERSAAAGPMEEPPTPLLWDVLLRNVRPWNIQQVEFLESQNEHARRMRWTDPSLTALDRCRWSISVSLPGEGPNGCELRVSSVEPIVEGRHLDVLTTLLKTFGAHFAAHADELFGATLDAETHRQPQRKAA